MRTSADQTSPPGMEPPEVWVERHAEFLFRYAVHRVESGATAEDLVQETLLSGLERCATFDGRSALRTWLVAILRHKIADHFRRAGREPAQGEPALEAWAEERFTARGKWSRSPRRWSWTTSAAERAELADTLRSCLEKLPAQTAELFVLHDQRRVPAPRLAASVGITSANLATRLYRARLALRECLEQNWFRREGP